jgi:hypothetical protein
MTAGTANGRQMPGRRQFFHSRGAGLGRRLRAVKLDPAGWQEAIPRHAKALRIVDW